VIWFGSGCTANRNLRVSEFFRITSDNTLFVTSRIVFVRSSSDGDDCVTTDRFQFLKKNIQLRYFVKGLFSHTSDPSPVNKKYCQWPIFCPSSDGQTRNGAGSDTSEQASVCMFVCVRRLLLLSLEFVVCFIHAFVVSVYSFLIRHSRISPRTTND